MAIVSGLYAAQKTGQGRDVEVSLLDTAYSMLTYLAIWNLNRGFEPKRYPGSAHQTLVPVQTFRTSDGFITIFCGKEKFWQLLCAKHSRIPFWRPTHDFPPLTSASRIAT